MGGDDAVTAALHNLAGLSLGTSGSTSAPVAAATAPIAPGGTPPRTPRVTPPRDSHALSIAPMMDWTDRHYRYLARLLSSKCQLYTEMLVDATLTHSPHAAGYLRFHPAEQPLTCQLGGSDPASLAASAVAVAAAGYTEVNLNCGCPSDKVAGRGTFGARLMFTPELVAECCAAMAAAAPSLSITVKCRLGADSMETYPQFVHFIDVVSRKGGVSHFIIHARGCVLSGFSPIKNRTVPPLRWDWVLRVAVQFPSLKFTLNGGVTD